MGLLRSVTSVITDTWKDYFVCESLDDNVLMIKGSKKGKHTDDVITNGSGIVVADGQCAIVVDDGVVVEVAAEAGYYTFDTTKSPSIFDGGLKGITDTFKLMLERFTYGGETNRSQVVYYINTKEIFGNMFGTASPIPFRISDPSINFNLEVGLKCNGEYSIHITNPILFYKNVAGNKDIYYKENIESQLKAEFLNALQPALAKLTEQGVKMYSDIPLHTFELSDNLNEVLSSRWSEKRGITIGTIAFNAITPREEDLQRLQNRQESASIISAEQAAAHLAAAQAQALRDAANNANGAINGFMGVNMAGNSANAISDIYASAAKNQAAGGFCPYCGKPTVADAVFCSSCGKQIK